MRGGFADLGRCDARELRRTAIGREIRESLSSCTAHHGLSQPEEEQSEEIHQRSTTSTDGGLVAPEMEVSRSDRDAFPTSETTIRLCNDEIQLYLTDDKDK